MRATPYGPFPYSPIIERPRWNLPHGARVALWVVPNLEFFGLDQPLSSTSGGSGAAPNVPAWSVRDYGNRVGVFRLMEILDRFGIRATAALNSDLCDQHPQIIEAAAARGWEFMGHNRTNTVRLTDVAQDEERALIASTLDRIGMATGQRPRGWLSAGLQESWATLDHLIGEGVEYVADWVNDDQPYEIAVPGVGELVSIPYSTQVNDKPAFERRNHSASEFRDVICRHFDTLYREGEDSGRVMAIALHPYLSGVPHRIHALREALDYITGHDRVWLATGTEIVSAWKDHIVERVRPCVDSQRR